MIKLPVCTLLVQWMFAILVVVFLAPFAALGQSQTPGIPGMPVAPGNKKEQRLTQLQVFADTAQIKPMQRFHLVFLFDIKEDWHLYWKNPGAGAAPIQIAVEAPHGFVVEPAVWPRPKRIESPTGDMYCYDTQVAIFVPVVAREYGNVSAVHFNYTASWAVCDDQKCVIEREQSSFSFVSTLGQQNTEQIEKYRQLLPVFIEENEEATVDFDGRHLTIAVPAMGFTTAEFFPNPSPGVSFGKPEVTFEKDQVQVVVEVLREPKNFADTQPVAGGLIALGEKTDHRSYEFEVPLNAD